MTTRPSQPAWTEHSESSIAFMEMFNLKYPIVQAPMDGPATAPLAIAVANAGALGSLPLTWLSPELAYERIEKVRSQTSGSFFGNYVLNFPTSSLERAIEAGIRTIQFSWGVPGAELVDILRSHGIKIGMQVASRESAFEAMELQPDFLVCQGTEAGGHVQADQPLMTALHQVISIAESTPVVASGGIATGRDIRNVLLAGAAGAVLGSRFVATKESAAHPDYKEQLLAAAGEEDTVFTVCLNKVWPNATHRILRKNETFMMWEAAGCPPGPYYIGPPAGDRPGEHDIVAVQEDGSSLERYVGIVPVVGMRQCNANALGNYAGEGVGKIHDIPSAGVLVERLWREVLGA